MNFPSTPLGLRRKAAPPSPLSIVQPDYSNYDRSNDYFSQSHSRTISNASTSSSGGLSTANSSMTFSSTGMSRASSQSSISSHYRQLSATSQPPLCSPFPVHVSHQLPPLRRRSSSASLSEQVSNNDLKRLSDALLEAEIALSRAKSSNIPPQDLDALENHVRKCRSEQRVCKRRLELSKLDTRMDGMNLGHSSALSPVSASMARSRTVCVCEGACLCDAVSNFFGF